MKKDSIRIRNGKGDWEGNKLTIGMDWECRDNPERLERRVRCAAALPHRDRNRGSIRRG